MPACNFEVEFDVTPMGSELQGGIFLYLLTDQVRFRRGRLPGAGGVPELAFKAN
ncbi:MAG: hypothetical protein R3B07_02605 [Polyangiaceae bacterium]